MKKPPALAAKRGEHAHADHVVVGPARAGPLGVLLLDQQDHVHGDERQQDDQRDQEARAGCRAGGRITVPGNSPPNSEVATQEPTTGIDSMIAVGDPQAGAGQRVVGQRVAGEALE